MPTYRPTLNHKTASARPRRRCIGQGGAAGCDYEIRTLRSTPKTLPTVDDVLRRQAAAGSRWSLPSDTRIAYVCRHCHREQTC